MLLQEITSLRFENEARKILKVKKEHNMEEMILLKLKGMIYKIQLRYLSCIFYLFLVSCGVSYDWDSDSQHLVNIDSLSVDDRLFYRCDAIYRKGTLLEWGMLAVSFCNGIDTINNIYSGFSIYEKVNMSILDETTFQESLYAHVSKNIPIEVGSDLFAKYSQDKIVSCPQVTELYKTKGIGAVNPQI